MKVRRNLGVSYAHLLRLRACRHGYRNVRKGLGGANRHILDAYAHHDEPAYGDGRDWQRQWLGRCNFWRARLRRAIRETEDRLGRPRRL